LAEELDPREACPRAGGGEYERVADAFDPFVVRAFLTVFFLLFFAMQIALSASGFGV
jgi:hypothetical protein